MEAKPGKKFCAEHGAVKGTESADRMPCPYDSKHTCYLRKLQKHLNKCNARPKELPSYIIPGINLVDFGCPLVENEVYSISSVPDDVLLDLIRRINTIYSEEALDCEESIQTHESLDAILKNPDLGLNARKHLLQNSSIIKNLEKNELLKSKVTYIEFGAGRGELGFWISQAMEAEENCSLLLIDRASHRHKSDNKLKGISNVNTERIRADIADIDLSAVPFLKAAENEVVGVSKHLCGMATDLALRCIVNGKSNGINIAGVAMAFCCHHRCTWSTFAGKEFLLERGLGGGVFCALCSISSWATCGSGKPKLKKKVEEEEEEEAAEEKIKDLDRYKKFGLTQEVREEIGRKCKIILNHGRLKYLESFGFKGKLIYYVDQRVSPENVCIIAKAESAKC